MLQFRQNGRWNQNPRVQQPEEVDLGDQREIDERRIQFYPADGAVFGSHIFR